MSSTEDQHTTVWLAGLPMAGTRPLTDGERAVLKRMARRCLWTFILALFLSPTLFLGILIGSAVFHIESLADSPAFSSILLLTFCSPAVAVLVARDASRKRKGIRGDLKDGTVWVFERPAEQGISKFARIEILPVSEVLWTLDGVPTTKWKRAVPGEASATPEYAATAAEWVAPAIPEDDRSPHFNDRELASAELVELRRHIRRIRWGSVPWAFGLDAWLLLAWWSADFSATPRHPVKPEPVAYFACLLALLWTLLAIAQWRHAARLARDAAIGRAVIVRVPVTVGDTTTLSDVMEYLPVSRVDWSIAGKPARWRLTPAERRKRK
jgi:hypothetical protein